MSTVGITAGNLPGVAGWDATLETFYCDVELFGPSFGEWPPKRVRYGSRVAEWSTVDALMGHMSAVGLGLDSASAGDLFDLGRAVASAVGEPEIAGVVGWGDRNRLVVVTPSRRSIEINPRFAHREYRLGWGDCGPATLDTARLIAGHVLGNCSAVDAEMFALGLTTEVLQHVEDSFSLSMASLCDWWLVDAEPRTSLNGELAEIVAAPSNYKQHDVCGGVDI